MKQILIIGALAMLLPAICASGAIFKTEHFDMKAKARVSIQSSNAARSVQKVENQLPMQSKGHYCSSRKPACAMQDAGTVLNKRAKAGSAAAVNVTYPNIGTYIVQGLIYAGGGNDFWQVADAIDRIELGNPGTYTVVAICQEAGEGKQLRIPVKENLDVEGEVSIELDPSTATESIRFIPSLPDKEAVNGPLIENGMILEEGNISSDVPSLIVTTLAHHTYGPLVDYTASMDRIKTSEGTYNDIHSATIWVTPALSEDWQVFAKCCFASPDNSTLMLQQLESNGAGRQSVISRHPWAYTSYDKVLTRSCYPKDTEVESEDMQFIWYEAWKGIPSSYMYLEGPEVNNATSLAYNLVQPKETGEEYITLLARLNPWDLGEPTYDDHGGSFTPIYSVSPSLLRQEGEEMVCITTPQLNTVYESFVLNTSAGVDRQVAMWGNPAFRSIPGVDPQRAGDNAPMLQYVDTSTKDVLGCSWLALGRVSESPSNLKSYIHCKFNGEEFVGPYNDDTVERYWDFWANINANHKHYTGTLEQEVEYRGIVVIDEIPLKSSIRAVTNCAQREDLNVPQLTMLQFRNSEGLVTDHFETAGEGRVAFTAGDFSHAIEYIFDDRGQFLGIDEQWNYEGTPEVKLEYSALNAGDWKEIAVEQKPELLLSTAYGGYFSGSLEGVEELSYKGWFDVRVTLTDAVGNTLESVISPAFNISSLVGIDEISADTDIRVVDRLNMQGLRVSSPTPGTVIIERMSDGTTRKRAY